ncbi:MAG: phosphoribosyl-AMP cyclohydrolase [Planctomycetes bacterium]|nr:phosphoribosyl-AMP cyclohydrolase [Planctomycetota bacterium]
MENLLEKLNFKNGLVPAIIVAEDGQALTLCYMDEEALRKTLDTGEVHVFRRSRGRVMKKGESSGHTQKVMEIRIDCEGNSLLIVVRQRVAACHMGYFTCYYRRYEPAEDSFQVREEKVFDPQDVYGG